MFVRVIPDVVKVEKSYWYRVSKATKKPKRIVVGSIVRINFNGRRTKGWVCETKETLVSSINENSKPLDPEKLKDVIEYVSDGPPSHMIDLCESLSQHYLSSPVTFLRSSSPKTIVNDLRHEELECGEKYSRKLILVDPRANRREIIESHLAQSGSTLICTPEQQSRFSMWLESLGKKVVNYGLDENVTSIVFKNATVKNCVVLGGRKSLFAPMSDCKAIIILDDSYEQLHEERSPYWNAVDVASKICEGRSIELVVISSVPSVNTKDFEVVDKRAEQKTWPNIFLDDKTSADPALGIFSREIVETIHQTIHANLNSAIILNNKSAASLLSCQTCQTIAQCEICNHSVSLIADINEELYCKNCKTSRAIVCLECRGTALKKLRKGIPSIINESIKMFPNYRVQELRKETRSDLDNLTEPCLFVGTEAILHDRKIIQSTGSYIFIDFDSLLFRNSQSAFNQTLVLVNRAVRALQKSNISKPVILSTRVPKNQIIQELLLSDFVSNTRRDLLLREQLQLAPYFATAKILSSSDAIETLYESINKDNIVGVETGDIQSSLLIRAKSHEDLYDKYNADLRHFMSRNKCSVYIDRYD